MNETLGLYVHIPFCRSKCDYCDFYSLAGREERMDDYQTALLSHIKKTAPLARGYRVDTVYIGGGTPSYYGERRLTALLAQLRRRFDLLRGAEITVECNPDSVDPKLLSSLGRSGVNRISLGAQSARDADLAALHRPHTFRQTREAVDMVREAGFQNLSLDLIYGLPGQSMAAWQETLEQAVELGPEHISCYGLKVEEGTPLWRRVLEGEGLPDDDLQADMYLWTVARLEQAGYGQYEISNFAKPGFSSRHNLKYWMCRPYLGFGPGAHSDFGGRRLSYRRDLEGYIAGALSGSLTPEEDRRIPLWERSGEYLMLRLRTSQGVEEWEYRREFSMSFDPLEQRLMDYERRGWAVCQDRRWRFTPQGFLLSNQLIGELLEIQERMGPGTPK